MSALPLGLCNSTLATEPSQASIRSWLYDSASSRATLQEAQRASNDCVTDSILDVCGARIFINARNVHLQRIAISAIKMKAVTICSHRAVLTVAALC